MSSSPSERAPESGALAAAGRAAGFADAGVADVAPSDYGEALDAWLAAGAHASMAWMERTAAIRKELTRKWGWARSALVGVASYLPAPRRRQDAPGLARYAARYAWGADYHELLRARLLDWAGRVEALVGRPFRHAALVDTSAVLERELAERAGLGWIGRNTCLIGPRGDSWRFIAVLLSELELEAPRRRLPERCGSCRACLDACPTDAFAAPHVLDARRCLSYLTIEHRGPIDEALMEQAGDWLFGCDVCQEVCPWNRRVEGGGDPGFAAAGEALARTSLAELAGMDDAAFRARFKPSPLARPKRAGMVRNALIVGAHVGDEEVLARAKALATDEAEDEGVRVAARFALRRAGRRGG